MQHVFEYYLKPNGEDAYHAHIVTQSGRHSKVGKQILRDINKFRAQEGMVLLVNEAPPVGNLERFQMLQLR